MRMPWSEKRNKLEDKVKPPLEICERYFTLSIVFAEHSRVLCIYHGFSPSDYAAILPFIPKYVCINHTPKLVAAR